MLQVLSVGRLACFEHEDAEVHSVFPYAVNILLHNKATPWNLITILGEQYSNLPTGVRVRLSSENDWRAVMAPGQRVRIRNRLLRWLDIQHSNLHLDSNSCWLPRLIRVPATMALVKTRLAVVNRLYDDLATKAIADNPLVQADLQQIGQYLSCRGNFSQFENSCHRLIGCGQGLTPFGDDFLVGYLASLDAVLHDKRFIGLRKHQTAVKTIITSRQSQTNDISRHYLMLAVHSHFSQTLNDLLAELINRRRAVGFLKTRLQDALQVGASSGFAAVKGVICGLELILNFYKRSRSPAVKLN